MNSINVLYGYAVLDARPQIYAFKKTNFCTGRANGLRYLRWGGDGEAVQPEKCSGAENCLRCAQNPQRQVHALLGVLGQS
jgi:hypothetical protein